MLVVHPVLLRCYNTCWRRSPVRPRWRRGRATPRIPQCCDNPSSPYRPGITCGCLCHYLTPEDLASIPDVSTESPDVLDRREDTHERKTGRYLPWVWRAFAQG